jgi:CheY-like chemotaxis protein
MQNASSVLIVDKDPKRIIPVLHENKGYLVDVVETGQEALAQFKQRSYDVVLMEGNQPS